MPGLFLSVPSEPALMDILFELRPTLALSWLLDSRWTFLKSQPALK